MEAMSVLDASTLLEALPYIRLFHGQTIVIKYGGAAMRRDDLKEEFARDVVLLKYVGMRPIVVHGGGPEITSMMERVGVEAKFDPASGRRISDADTVELAKMVLVGKLNNEIVRNLNRHAHDFGPAGTAHRRGPAAIGFCGDDGALFEVTRRVPAEGEPDLGLVGAVRSPADVRTDVLEGTSEDFIPVIASVGGDRQGVSHNVNADEVAGAVAAALEAHKVIFLTDVPGLMADPDDPSTQIRLCALDVVSRMLEEGGAGGGMVPKLEACETALRNGVTAAHIIDGREPHSLLVELFTDAGVGTKITKDGED